MEEKDITPEIPKQEVGAHTDVEVVETLETIEEAKQLFAKARERLLNVNTWHELAGALSATFVLTNEKGEPVERLAEVKDLFKIDIPGPGTNAGKGYDWVQVEKIEEKEDKEAECESILMRVRPAENPSTTDHNIAHFFADTATSNFTLLREKNKVIGAVHGRNEVPNTGTEKLLDKARNAIVGVSAFSGFSNPQWSALVHGWLGKK